VKGVCGGSGLAGSVLPSFAILATRAGLALELVGLLVQSAVIREAR